MRQDLVSTNDTIKIESREQGPLSRRLSREYPRILLQFYASGSMDEHPRVTIDGFTNTREIALAPTKWKLISLVRDKRYQGSCIALFANSSLREKKMSSRQ